MISGFVSLKIWKCPLSSTFSKLSICHSTFSIKTVRNRTSVVSVASFTQHCHTLTLSTTHHLLTHIWCKFPVPDLKTSHQIYVNIWVVVCDCFFDRTPCTCLLCFWKALTASCPPTPSWTVAPCPSSPSLFPLRGRTASWHPLIYEEPVCSVWITVECSEGLPPPKESQVPGEATLLQVWVHNKSRMIWITEAFLMPLYNEW